MSYYSNVRNVEFSHSEVTFSQEEWDEFKDSMKSSYLFYGFIWSFDGAAIVVEEGESGKAYDIDLELIQLQRFFKERGMSFSLDFEIYGEEVGDICKYHLDESGGTRAEAKITFSTPIRIFNT